MAHARTLLDDVLLNEVLDEIEEAAIKAWRSSPDAAARDVAWYSLKAAERVRATLKGIVDNGLIEAARAVR